MSEESSNSINTIDFVVPDNFTDESIKESECSSKDELNENAKTIKSTSSNFSHRYAPVTDFIDIAESLPLLKNVLLTNSKKEEPSSDTESSLFGPEDWLWATICATLEQKLFTNSVQIFFQERLRFAKRSGGFPFLISLLDQKIQQN